VGRSRTARLRATKIPPTLRGFSGARMATIRQMRAPIRHEEALPLELVS